MARSADSPGVKVFEKDLLQEWQKYSCRDVIHLHASRDTGILDSVSVSDGSITSLDVLDRELEQEQSHERDGPRIAYSGRTEAANDEERVGLGVTVLGGD
jgi:hypothetical protein